MSALCRHCGYLGEVLIHQTLKPEDLPEYVAFGFYHRVLLIEPAASFIYYGCFKMIKKASLMTALSVTAFSGWAQDSNSDTLVVTANRFQQPVNTVLAPTDVVTHEDIQRWQSKDLNDVMRRLPGVDIAQNGGMGNSSSLYVRGTEGRHVLVLIDGVPMARAGDLQRYRFGADPGVAGATRGIHSWAALRSVWFRCDWRRG